MSFLHGHYVPDFDPGEELPDPGSLRYRMYTHDINSNCNINENRYKIDNFHDTEENKDYASIYCWKGIIRKNPDCKVGSVCDPNSYAGARSRFCLTWGCPDPMLYVADDKGQPIVNERGGIIVYNKKEDCRGSLVNQIKCVTGGLRQSANHLLDPNNRKQMLMQVIILASMVTIFAIFMTRFRRSKNKRITGIRKQLDPRFAKTKPIFPKRLS